MKFPCLPKALVQQHFSTGKDLQPPLPAPAVMVSGKGPGPGIMGTDPTFKLFSRQGPVHFTIPSFQFRGICGEPIVLSLPSHLTTRDHHHTFSKRAGSDLRQPVVQAATGFITAQGNRVAGDYITGIQPLIHHNDTDSALRVTGLNGSLDAGGTPVPWQQ